MARTLLLIGTRKGLFLLESDADRRDWSCAGRSARAGPSTTPFTTRLRRDLRRRRERVARLGRLAQRRPRRDLGALERGPRLRRGRRAQGVEGRDARRDRTGAARRRRGAGHLREPRRRRDLLAADDARGPARQRGVGRPVEPAARPPRHLGHHARRRRCVALLGDRPGRRRLRDRRRRRAGRRATGACAPTGRGRTRRSASASTGSSARPPTRTACTSRTTSACTAATTAATRGPRSPRACRASSASPPRRIRTTTTPSTSSRSTRATPAACPTGEPRSGARATPARPGSELDRGLPQRDAHLGVLRAAMAIDDDDEPGLYFGTSTGQLFASTDDGESWSEIARLPAADLVGRGRDRGLTWPSCTSHER